MNNEKRKIDLDFPVLESDDVEVDETIRDDDTEDAEAPEQTQDYSQMSLFSIPLPDGVRTRVMKQYFFAACMALATIVLCIVYREPVYLVGFFVAGYLVYVGVSLTLNYVNGKIVELPVICASVSTTPTRKATRVVFRTNDDTPSYYEFFIPGRMERQIMPNMAYVIYFDPDRPRELVGYTAL